MMSRRRAAWGGRAIGGLVIITALVSHTFAGSLDEMTGCWISDQFAPTSLLSDAAKAESAQIVIEKMWLKFDKIPGTEFLVLGHIYEWDDAGTYVLGPTYQNGALNPGGSYLTFGFPMGGLDHVTMPAKDKLLYVHTKSSTKSAMSVRHLSRVDCAEAAKLEANLLERQEALK